MTGMMFWMVEGKSVDGTDNVPPTSEALPRSERPNPCVRTTFVRKKLCVTGSGDSLLRVTEGPVRWTDPPLREVCCLPGACVKDITRKLPSLV